MSHRSVSATDFKAKCLALLDEVNERGDSVTITKRGKPVAVLQPVVRSQRKTTQGILAGKIDALVEIADTSPFEGWDPYRKWQFANAEPVQKRQRKAL